MFRCTWVRCCLVLSVLFFAERGDAQDQGRRARAQRSRCLRYSPRPRRQYFMLIEERLCKRHPVAQHPCSSTAGARHCRLLFQSLRALKSCVPLLHSRPRVMPVWTIVWELVK